MLAQSLSKKLGIPCIQLVKKTRHTQSQTALTREERLINVVGSFASNAGDRMDRYQHIIVVDDIVTTGSTINEIGYTIKKYNPQANIR